MANDSEVSSPVVTLERDEIWDAFDLGSHKSFSAYVSEVIQRRDELPGDVERRLQVVEALLCHSYFEYDFLDVAMERTLFTFEMALRTRMDEMGILDQDARRNLVDCIGDASDAYLFEDGEDAAHTLRKLRNRCAHPKRNWRRGPAAIQIIERVIWVINGLYDDPELRVKRHQEREKLQAALNACIESGGVGRGIPMGGDSGDSHKSNLLLHDVKVLYVDNHGASTEYHLALFPIFDVEIKPPPADTPENESQRDKQIRFPEPIFVTASEWEKQEKDAEVCFVLDSDGRVLRISPIRSEENRDRYQSKWVDNTSPDRRLAMDSQYRTASSHRNRLMRQQQRARWQSEP